MSRAARALAGLLVLLALALPALAGGRRAALRPRARVKARAWAAADRLFRRDPSWHGADDAYSVRLGRARTLWLFGDSFVGRRVGRGRGGTHFINNTIGIQHGDDPSRARVDFHWDTAKDGSPRAFFRDRTGYLWPGGGTRLGKQKNLILFFMRVRNVPDRRGKMTFDVFGSKAILVDNPDAPPEQWRQRALEMPKNSLGVILGSASVFPHEGYLYAYGTRRTKQARHEVYLVRWPEEAAARGDLRRPEWWMGAGKGFAQRRGPRKPAAILRDGQAEFTVHYDPKTKLFVQVQTVSVKTGEIAIRYAPRPEGPFGSKEVVYVPPESGQEGVSLYAGKGHEDLDGDGADLVLTYASNTADPGRLFGRRDLYFPRFARLRVEDETSAARKPRRKR